MIKISTLTVLLLHLLYIRVQGIIVYQPVKMSCSKYVKPGTTNLSRQIEIPPPPVNDEYYLKVALNTDNEVMKQNSIGFGDYRLALAQTIYDTVRAVRQSKPLLYDINYPSHKPVPTVSAIWFNNQQICPGLESNGNICATIELGHIVYPPNNDPNSWTWHRNSSTYYIHNPSEDRLNYLSQSRRTTAIPPVQFANNECGITNYYTDSTNRLFPNGQETFPGQWPWVVGLFVKKEQYKFQCTGSVLTTRHVITAGHCLKKNFSSNDTIHPNDLLVALGRFNFRHFREEGSVNREVANYTIHPDYAHYLSGDSDLTILILTMPVEFSPFIKPICLWFGSTNLQNIINKRGYVVGWGKDLTNRFPDYPRMARVPIVSQEICLRSNQIFFSFTSDRTLCAGKDESGPGSGESGSGLVIFDDTTGRYRLRGIVSRNLSKLKDYVVYVDIAKYISWIQQQISTT
ncbi:serine protease gd [Monomorium pharaonis]|uniref:serine protease gd n=1 Tax=Monomorium pharaonis TaxID=307658 RepID=UPI001745E1DD|nr:serine protease gd [Monomorium pharaonis]XP_012528112.2 serine protease gd [Monomorium pharaonis]XP_012528113.2 serine protease gd [Monomorium pharaonis]XP_012528114.2 serine protease gd [Monomorium pharaonis]